MKEFIDKLIERLEEEKSDWNYDYNVPINKAISIVNELAEEYKDKVMIDGQYCWQTCSATEHCKECNRLCNGSIDYYENYDFMEEEYKDKPSDEWEIIYDKVCSLEKKYSNGGNVESVNDCIKLENLLQYFKEELQSAEEYKLFGNSEQVNDGWIPVLERLPKEDERILCLHSDGFIDCGVLIGETWCCDMDEYAVIRDDIHAWMPLPAPYTEGE